MAAFVVVLLIEREGPRGVGGETRATTINHARVEMAVTRRQIERQVGNASVAAVDVHCAARTLADIGMGQPTRVVELVERLEGSISLVLRDGLQHLVAIAVHRHVHCGAGCVAALGDLKAYRVGALRHALCIHLRQKRVVVEKIGPRR